ncbi:hypothetical protein WJX77_008062 [Trebouxia sp. C0004]
MTFREVGEKSEASKIRLCPVKISKKKSGVKNQAGNKRLNTPANSIPAPAMLYATASGVTTITGAFQKCNEVTSRPTGQGHEGALGSPRTRRIFWPTKSGCSL